MPKMSKVLFQENKDVLDYLKESRLFGHLEESILRKIVPLSKFLLYPSGTEILKEGELNDTIYFLVRGTVSVYTEDEHILSLHRLGDIFGEISIINDKPCNATVISDGEVNLFCFSSHTVGHYSDLHPEELQNVLYRIFAKILTEKLYLTTHKAQQFEKTNRLLLTTQTSLEEVHEKLKKSHEELEIRVKERTKELTVANEKLKEEIAERKKLEEERAKLESQLRHSQKMETIGTLAGGIAHEFNNLLQGMFIGMDILNFNLPDDSPLKEHLLNSRKFGQSAKTLINQILTFSHQEEEKLELIEIAASIEEVLKMIRLTFPFSIEIKQNIKINQENVCGNTTQLQQILINMCANAKYAMQDKGVLEITLVKEFLNKDKISVLDLETEGDYLKLTIRDTGSGIPQDIQERIFDPFFTTKPIGEGSGMGLSVVHGIVQNWKGTITLESEEGQGVQFNIYFPVAESEDQISTIPNELPQISHGHENILLVDDEESLNDYVKNTLISLGYNAKSTYDAQTALEMMKSDSPQFDILIIDYALPQMSGIQLSQEILKLKPDLPIILITGDVDKVSSEEVKKVGIRTLLKKPFSLIEISATIRAILDQE